MRKLCLSTKFPHQEIRWNYGILRSDWVSGSKYNTFPKGRLTQIKYRNGFFFKNTLQWDFEKVSVRQNNLFDIKISFFLIKKEVFGQSLHKETFITVLNCNCSKKYYKVCRKAPGEGLQLYWNWTPSRAVFWEAFWNFRPSIFPSTCGWLSLKGLIIIFEAAES